MELEKDFSTLIKFEVINLIILLLFVFSNFFITSNNLKLFTLFYIVWYLIYVFTEKIEAVYIFSAIWIVFILFMIMKNYF